MKKIRAKKEDIEKIKRLSFPLDEKKHSWLPRLLDAYYIIDKGVADAIEAEHKKGRRLACTKGCSTCCNTQKDIPVYPLEMVGITWFAIEKVSGAERDKLKERLNNFEPDSGCPFLVDEICLVHEIRPVGCRQFNVFTKQCATGEDPYHTRRGDVMQPVKKYVDQAFFIMFPFYGIEKESERVEAVESGKMHSMAREMHSFNWQSLAREMNGFDSRKPEENSA